jgi:hypothetical protein
VVVARGLAANLDDDTVSAGAPREILDRAPLAVAIIASITQNDVDTARRNLGEIDILFPVPPDGSVSAGVSII